MATATGTNTNIGTKETFLDRNAKLIPSDETTMALTNAKWIAGHHTVAKVQDLYNIYPFILNPKYYAGTDEDDANHTETIGQLWYVVSDKAFYQLIDWNNRGNANGWSKTNIKAITSPGGINNEQHIGPNDFITKVSINGDGKLEGTTGTFTNSTSSGSYNNIATKTVIPVNTQILTNVNIDHTGKLSYTYGIRPVLSVTKAAATTHSYTSSQPNLQFDVVDGIDVNDHNITYHHSTITTLSQSHHGGSFNGDFLTSASLSSTGTLSGTSKTFQNQQTNNTGKITNPGAALTINYDNAQVITYSYIDHNGKLWTEASALRQPVHQISVSSNANKVTLSYNGISNGDKQSTKYDIDLPIASKTNAGVITGNDFNSFLKKSPLAGNEIEYVWSGTQANYDKLGSEVANHPDTLFIIHK